MFNCDADDCLIQFTDTSDLFVMQKGDETKSFCMAHAPHMEENFGWSFLDSEKDKLVEAGVISYEEAYPQEPGPEMPEEDTPPGEDEDVDLEGGMGRDGLEEHLYNNTVGLGLFSKDKPKNLLPMDGSIDPAVMRDIVSATEYLGAVSDVASDRKDISADTFLIATGAISDQANREEYLKKLYPGLDLGDSAYTHIPPKPNLGTNPNRPKSEFDPDAEAIKRQEEIEARKAKRPKSRVIPKHKRRDNEF